MHEGPRMLDPYVISDSAKPNEIVPFTLIQDDPNPDPAALGAPRVSTTALSVSEPGREANHALGAVHERHVNFVQRLLRRTMNHLRRDGACLMQCKPDKRWHSVPTCQPPKHLRIPFSSAPILSVLGACITSRRQKEDRSLRSDRTVRARIGYEAAAWAANSIA